MINNPARDEIRFLLEIQCKLRFLEIAFPSEKNIALVRRAVIDRMALLAQAVALMLLLVIAPTMAMAHSWYDWQCCSDQDCRPVPCDEITELKDGFEYDGVAFSRSMEKPSQDRHCHVCIIGQGTARHGLCVYTQQGS